MKFFCCHQRKALCQIKTHLVTENRECTRSGTIGFLRAVIENMLEEIQVLLHAMSIKQMDNSLYLIKL